MIGKYKVIKIGGSCLKKYQDLDILLNILKTTKYNYVVVVSAFFGVTKLIDEWYNTKNQDIYNQIIKIHKNIFEKVFPEKNFEKDFYYIDRIKNIHRLQIQEALTLGESMSSFIVLLFLKKNGLDIQTSSPNPAVFGNSDFLNLDKTKKIIIEYFNIKKSQHILTDGFSSWHNGVLDNLGKEGSDMTAVLWAYTLGVPCVLYKDVGALYTKDPNKNINVKKIDKISFDEYKKNFYNAGIIYNRVIDFCIKNNYDIFIYDFKKNILGTKISS